MFDVSKKDRLMTLPTESARRKDFPILSGCIKYFPAALAGVANISKLGNDKHNPGEALHHARGKSMDHGDCIVRHLMDVEDLITASAKGDARASVDLILLEASSLAWRALAYSQELHEKYGAPLAPSAKVESPAQPPTQQVPQALDCMITVRTSTGFEKITYEEFAKRMAR